MKLAKDKIKKIINSLLTVIIIALLVVLLRLDIDNAIIWIKQFFK